MLPWVLLDTATVPGTDTPMTLHRRGHVYSIRVGGAELMNNWVYGIDCGLADQGCAALARRDGVRVLIGGLGMGFTLARTLSHLGPGSQVLVAELVPAVVRWNEEIFGELAGHPLRDPRVGIVEDDVGQVLRHDRRGFDAILLDVDNGPEGLSRASNDKLYGRAGLAVARKALRPDGVLALWSHSGDQVFSERLKRAWFKVEEHHLKHKGGRGRQTIFVGRPRAPATPGATPSPQTPASQATGEPARSPSQAKAKAKAKPQSKPKSKPKPRSLPARLRRPAARSAKRPPRKR